MSWSDPEGAWQQRVRGRARMPKIFVVCSLLWFAVPIWVTVRMLRRVGFDEVTLLVAVASSIVLISFLVFAVRQWRESSRRMRRTLELVPRHDGLVCPVCVRTLEPEQSTDAEAAPVGRCPRCRKRYHLARTREHWLEAPFLPAKLAATRGRLTRVRAKLDDAAFEATSAAEQVMRRRALIVLGLSMTPLLAWNVYRNGVVIGLIDSAPFLLMVGGFTLVLAGSGWKVSASRRCAACGYEQADASSERCPECGVNWNGPGGTVRGEPVRRPWLIGIGLAMIVMFALGPVTRMVAGPIAWSSQAPTWLLFERIEAGQRTGIGDDEAWSRLVGRQLDEAQRQRLLELAIEEVADSRFGVTDSAWGTIQGLRLEDAFDADQRRRMIEAVAEKRRRFGFISPPEGTWIEDRLARGEVPEDLIEAAERALRY